MSHYFTKETEEAIEKFIVAYNKDDHDTCKLLFNSHIVHAFNKLIESIVYVYNFYLMEDEESLKRECLTDLYKVIHKYNPEKGSKAFSYFNMITKNWFMSKARRKKNDALNIDELSNEDAASYSMIIKSPEEIIIENEDNLALNKAFLSWRKKKLQKASRQVLEAIIILKDNISMTEKITAYNKKNISQCISAFTGLDILTVKRSIKEIKNIYVKWKKEYLSEGD